VRQAADGGGETSVDAKMALALILAREKNYPKAISLIQGLHGSYPHNFLYAMTEADLFKASGHLPEAVTAYRKLLSLGHEGMFPEARLELVAYKLGETFRLQENYSSAVEAYRLVSEFPNVDRELNSKAALCEGEMYDLLGQRDSAVKHYQVVVQFQENSIEAKIARRLLNHPYRIQ
jgi:tetratricopeptide (TPR) repeat protein